MLTRLRDFWNRGIIGKVAIVAAGVFGTLVLCCIIALLIPSPRQTANTPTVEAVVPTAAPAAAVPTAQPTERPAPTETPAATAPARPAGYVSRELLGDDWPLTVDDGILACHDRAVVLTSGGTVYAVNGTAKQRGIYADIAPIWADHPTVEGLKKNLGPLLDRGLALC